MTFREFPGTSPSLCGPTANRFFNTYPNFYPNVPTYPTIPQFTAPQFLGQYLAPPFVPQYVPPYVPQYAAPQFLPQFPTMPPVNPMVHTPINWTLPLFNAYRPLL